MNESTLGRKAPFLIAAVTALLLVLALGGTAHAASADPSTVDFGNVPIGTAAVKVVAITLDAGETINSSLTTGTGTTAPFGLAFYTCTNFAGPGTCDVKETYEPTTKGLDTGVTDVYFCVTSGAGGCDAVEFNVEGVG